MLSWDVYTVKTSLLRLADIHQHWDVTEQDQQENLPACFCFINHDYKFIFIYLNVENNPLKTISFWDFFTTVVSLLLSHTFLFSHWGIWLKIYRGTKPGKSSQFMYHGRQRCYSLKIHYRYFFFKMISAFPTPNVESTWGQAKWMPNQQ